MKFLWRIIEKKILRQICFEKVEKGHEKSNLEINTSMVPAVELCGFARKMPIIFHSVLSMGLFYSRFRQWMSGTLMRAARWVTGKQTIIISGNLFFFYRKKPLSSGTLSLLAISVTGNTPVSVKTRSNVSNVFVKHYPILLNTIYFKPLNTSIKLVGWYWIVLDNVGWYWMVLDNVEWYWMVLDNVEWYWMVLDNVKWSLCRFIFTCSSMICWIFPHPT